MFIVITVEPVRVERGEGALRVLQILQHQVDDTLRRSRHEAHVERHDQTELVWQLRAQLLLLVLPTQATKTKI